VMFERFKRHANTTYAELLKLTFARKNGRVLFTQSDPKLDDAKDSLVYDFFPDAFYTKNRLNRSWRFFVLNDQNKICASIGLLTTDQLAMADAYDPDADKVIPPVKVPDGSFWIDYRVLQEYRGQGIGRRALLEVLKLLFGKAYCDTCVKNALLNIVPYNIPSLSIAHKSGFKSFKEFGLDDPTTINYVLNKAFYFDNRERIEDGVCTDSNDLDATIQKARINASNPQSPSSGITIDKESSETLQEYSVRNKRLSSSISREGTNADFFSYVTKKTLLSPK